MQGYKDSGIEWIGSIPEEWNIGRMKYITDIIMGQSPESFQIRDDEGRYLFMQGNSEFGDKYPKAYKYCDNPKKISRANDILMSVRAPVGALNISDVAYGIGRGLCSISAINIDKNYFWFFLNKSKDDFQFFSNGSTFEAITIESLANFPILIPGREQQQIADFLDEECGKIDRITKKIERQIEILKEYKKSLIAETVTKGLNKNVKMKDSGVEWIGKIPIDWEIKKIKHLATEPNTLFIDGDWIESKDISESGIRYLTSGNVGEGEFKRQGEGYISEETFEKLKCLSVYPGDLMISRLNLPIGRTCIVPEDNAIYVVAVDNVILRPNKNCNKKYLMYVMNTNGYSNEAEIISRGTTMKRISRTLLGEMKVCTPSLEEQQLIADYLNQKCSEIDLILSKKANQLDIIKEHKKSLIYEYVTGKKRVGGIENGD
ncbi:restriction endonuclease subunit S [Campylobacter sp. RM16187]|uniref:restriction endonuclease subunit S n=1 Tax=Campylobacter sp. RM16187 TaxID=1660063 RepID=UPI0021B5207D|nr:restriction endonuclease subunit S [Campylobacter sp. RM16187]QKG28739.1 type I restriction/modification system, S subunit [Campylobacter sp. RM16187]